MAAQDLKTWAAKVEANLHLIFLNTATAVRDSVVEGSPVTGAPGQPVDTGNLKSSWQLGFPEPGVAEISTHVEYAPAIEEGVGPHGPMTLRSQVGGFHSVALTRSNFDKLVEDVTRSTVGA